MGRAVGQRARGSTPAHVVPRFADALLRPRRSSSGGPRGRARPGGLAEELRGGFAPVDLFSGRISTSNGRIRPDGVVEFDLLGGRVDLSGWSTRPLGVAESTCRSGRIAALWRGEWDFFYDDSTPPKWPLGPTPGATRRACRVDSPGRVGARGVDSARGGGRLGAASRPRLGRLAGSDSPAATTCVAATSSAGPSYSL